MEIDGGKESFRVLVSTDLGGDPDDIQSLVHLLHYSDILKVEGIVSTTGPGSNPTLELIKEWIKRVDLNYLRENGYPELMAEKDVLSAVKRGSVRPGGPGAGKNTEGSEWIVKRASANAGAPLWLLVWGSLTDVAQALHDRPSIKDEIRIYSIGSSNTENDRESRDYLFEGLQEEWPYLWWIENGILPKFSHETFRGYYLGGKQDGEWGNRTFVEENIRDKGTKGGGEFDRKLGDAFPLAGAPGDIEGILKEGDSPSFLYLLSSAIGDIGDVEDPTTESWGGRFRRPYPATYPNYYSDLEEEAERCQATINRWRTDYLKDWKRRWRRY